MSKLHPPRTLIFCSAGARIKHLSWLTGLDSQTNMDAALAYYGAEASPANLEVKYFISNRDYKIPNFLQLIRECSAVLEYDLYIFIDDDIIVSASDLGKWRSQIISNGLDVCQPALTTDSKADWPHTKVQAHLGVDIGQFVEIQCFALSRRALQAALPYFFMVKTGAGLDLCLYHLSARAGMKSAVVHDLQIVHPHRPEDETVRRQFSQFAEFNRDMMCMLTFCFEGSASFNDLVHSSRILGDTRLGVVRSVAWVRFVWVRMLRVLGRILKTLRRSL